MTRPLYQPTINPRHPFAMGIDENGTPVRRGRAVTEESWGKRVAVAHGVVAKLAALDRTLTNRETRNLARAEQTIEHDAAMRRARAARAAT